MCSENGGEVGGGGGRVASFLLKFCLATAPCVIRLAQRACICLSPPVWAY